MMHGRLAAGVSLALVLGMAGPGPGQVLDEPERALRVEIQFAEDRISPVSIRRVQTIVPRQYGVPQLSPLFFELTGEGGQVLYAGSLADPRTVVLEGGRAAGDLSGQTVHMPEASVTVLLPDRPEARELKGYRRAATGSPGRRVLLFRVGVHP